jgi:uncharacterized protein (DUF2461 family)
MDAICCGILIMLDLCLACVSLLQDGSTVLHMVCKSIMCNRSSQRHMAKVIVDAGVDVLAKDKVRVGDHVQQMNQ